MSVTDRLDRALAATTAPEEASREGWRIRSRDEAAWASRKLARAQRDLEALEAWKRREIERIERAAQPEQERLDRDADFFQGLLGRYLTELVQDGRRTKSLELPGGTIRLRKARPRLEVENEAEAVAWLAEHAPEYLRTAQRVDKAALKGALIADGSHAVMVETGEVVPWARLEPAEEHVRFSLPDDAGDRP